MMVMVMMMVFVMMMMMIITKHQHNNTESNSDNINTYALSSIPASSGELDCPSLKMARNDQEGSL